VRIALSLLLLSAAALKAYELATEPVLGSGVLDSRWLLAATVEFELLFGIWLLANIWPRLTSVAAIGLFGIFACVSLYKAISGYATCGCFGPVPVNPWYTAILDSLAVLSLVCCRAPSRSRLPGAESCRLRARAVAVLAVWLLAGVPAAIAMGRCSASAFGEDGIISGDGDLVVINPEAWVGARFPLLRFIENANGANEAGEPPLRARLVEGDWLVLLYREGCPRCRRALEVFLRDAEAEMQRDTARFGVAVVDTSSVANPTGATEEWCERGRTSRTYRWFLSAPTRLRLHNGVVRASVRAESGGEQGRLEEHVGGPSA
jgi:hypothetical protein